MSIKYSSAMPDKNHVWGAFAIRQDGQADLSKAQWFSERGDAVKYAQSNFNCGYVIGRAWFPNQDPNSYRGA